MEEHPATVDVQEAHAFSVREQHRVEVECALEVLQVRGLPVEVGEVAFGGAEGTRAWLA